MYPEKEIVNDIKSGGDKRDQALKYLLLRSNYSKSVKRIIDEGGGIKQKSDEVFESCIIRLDRLIRRNLWDFKSSLNDYFEKEAKQIWREELITSKTERNNVINWLNSDSSLKEQIFNAIKNYKGSIEDAEDCFQNGIIQLDTILKEGKYNGGALKGFFYQLCFNLWRNEQKKLKPTPLFNNQYLQLVQIEDPQSVLEKKEYAKLLVNIFQKLGEACQQILKLKYFITEQYSMDEIARQMGFKNAQIASNTLTKCRKKLWQLYEELKSKSL